MPFMQYFEYFSITYFLTVYSYAYFRTIQTVVKKRTPVNSVAFSLFAVGSTLGGINAYYDGSMAPTVGYGLLACWGIGTVVVNEYTKRKIRHDFDMHGAWQDIIDYTEMPLSLYDKKGRPIVWNNALTKITGYSHKEVSQYFEAHGEIVSLLYEGEELERVRTHLASLEKTGGYENTSFILRTKSGEHVSIAWTTKPYHGGSIRKGSVIGNENPAS